MRCPKCKSEVGVVGVGTKSFVPLHYNWIRLIERYKIPFNCDLCGSLYFPYCPVLDRVFVWPDPVSEESKGIYIPERFREEQEGIGTVLAIGKGYYDKKRKRFVPTEVVVGQRVIYDKGVPWRLGLKADDGIRYDIVFFGERDVKALVVEEE